MGCYSYLKVLNMLLYNATLCLAIGYLNTSKFNSKFTYYLFMGMIVARPCLIGLYSIILCLLEACRGSQKKKKKDKRSKAEEDYGSEVEMSENDQYNIGYDDVRGKDDMNNSYYSSAATPPALQDLRNLWEK